MNRTDYLLTASAPTLSRSSFVVDTMSKISDTQHRKPTYLPWKKIAFAAVLSFVIVVTSITTYAYATGTDPITLIRRWIEGNTVKVDYGGRTFEHGAKLTYSDAAITAQAELDLLDIAHFHDTNTIQVPVNGVEYVDDPSLYGSQYYVYPKIAYISRADSATISVHEVFRRGDKMSPSAKVDTTYTVPESSLKLRKDLDAITLNPNEKVLVALYQNTYLRHASGGGAATEKATIRFAYTLSHPLDSYMEASQNSPAQAKAYTSADDIYLGFEPLVETHLGAISRVCVNNGADTCDDDTAMSGGGKSLYGQTTAPTPQHDIMNQSNPDALAVFEGSLTPEKDRHDIIMRNLQGTITALSPTHISIKTSSGATWNLAYTSAQQQQFKSWYGQSLAVGSLISASIYQSVTELDARSVAREYIYMMTFVK